MVVALSLFPILTLIVCAFIAGFFFTLGGRVANKVL